MNSPGQITNIFYEEPINRSLMMIRDEILKNDEVLELLQLPMNQQAIDIKVVEQIEAWVRDNDGKKNDFIEYASRRDSLPYADYLKDDYALKGLLDSLEGLRNYDSVSSAEHQKKIKKEFIKCFLSLWFFEYNEVTDEIISKFIYSSAVPHFAEKINQNTVIPDGYGSVGYSVKMMTPIAINNTEEDPRGSVSIEDKLLRNFSYLDVPVIKEDKGGSQHVIYVYSIFLPYFNAWKNVEARLLGLVKDIIVKKVPEFQVFENYSKTLRLNRLFAEREEIDTKEKLVNACHNYISEIYPILFTGIIEKIEDDDSYKLSEYLNVNISKINSIRRKNQIRESYRLKKEEDEKPRTDGTGTIGPGVLNFGSVESKNKILKIEYYSIKSKEYNDDLTEICNKLADFSFHIFNDEYFLSSDYKKLKDKINICQYIISFCLDFIMLEDSNFRERYLIENSGDSTILRYFKDNLAILITFLSNKSGILEGIEPLFNYLVSIKNWALIPEHIISIKAYLKNAEQKLIDSRGERIKDLFHPSTINILQLVDEDRFLSDICQKYPPLVRIEKVHMVPEKRIWEIEIPINQTKEDFCRINIVKAGDCDQASGKDYTPVYYHMNKSNYEMLMVEGLAEKKIFKDVYDDEFTQKLDKIDTEISTFGRKDKYFIPIDESTELFFMGYGGKLSFAETQDIHATGHKKIIENLLKNYKDLLAGQDKTKLDVKLKEAEGWAHQLNSQLVVLRVITNLIDKKNEEKKIEGIDLLKSEILSVESYTTIIQEQNRVNTGIYFDLDQARNSYGPLLLVKELIFNSLRIAFMKFASDTRNEFRLDRKELFKKDAFIPGAGIRRSVRFDIIEALAGGKIGAIDVIKKNSIVKIEIDQKTDFFVVPIIAQSLQFHFTELFINALKHFHGVQDDEKLLKVEIDNRALDVNLIEEKNEDSVFKFKPRLLNNRPLYIKGISVDGPLGKFKMLEKSNRVGFIRVTFTNTFTLKDLLDKSIKLPGTKLGLKIIPGAIKKYFPADEIDTKLRYVERKRADGSVECMDYEAFWKYYKKVIKGNKEERRKYEKELLVYKITLPIPILMSNGE